MSSYHKSTLSAFWLNASNSAWLSQVMISGTNKSLPMTIGVAMAIRDMIPMPSGQIDQTAGEYFDTQASQEASEVLNTLNEMMPVNLSLVISVAKGFFMVHFENANRPFKAFGYEHKHGIKTLFGLNAHFSGEILKAMEENSSEIILRYDRVKSIIADMTKD